jgi:hypothetical protein
MRPNWRLIPGVAAALALLAAVSLVWSGAHQQVARAWCPPVCQSPSPRPSHTPTPRPSPSPTPTRTPTPVPTPTVTPKPAGGGGDMPPPLPTPTPTRYPLLPFTGLGGKG